MSYRVDFEVRDSELDSQGIVNNANYFIYMEHARHKFLKEVLNLDFMEMTKAKIFLLLVSSTIEFKKSLCSNDKFYITCDLSLEGKYRFLFKQEVRLASDDSLIAKGFNTGACLDKNINKIIIPEMVKKYFEQHK